MNLKFSELIIEPYSDEYFMRQAFMEAQQALEEGEVPIGAVVVSRNRIIGRGHNLTERLTDVTAHAEMQAITASSAALNSKYLPECTIYVTLEPCPMCAGALYWSQIGRLVFAAYDEKRGYTHHGVKLHPKTSVESGLMEYECSELIREFFRNRRS